MVCHDARDVLVELFTTGLGVADGQTSVQRFASSQCRFHKVGTSATGAIACPVLQARIFPFGERGVSDVVDGT